MLKKNLKRIGTGLFMAWCLSTNGLWANDPTGDDGNTINVKYENAPLELVIQSIMAVTKLNVVVDSKVTGRTTLNLKNVPWRQGLDLILRTNELGMRQVGNTLVIAPNAVIAKNFDQGITNTYPLRYAKAEDVQGIITALLGKQTAGEISVQVEKRLNALLVSAPQDMFKRIEELLARVDRPVPQVMIDIKVVEVSSDFTNNLGFDWSWGTGGVAGGLGTPGQGSVLQYTEYARNLDNADQYSDPARGMNLFNFGDFFRSNFFFNAVFTAITQTSESRILSSPRLVAMNGVQANLNISRELTFAGGVDQQPQSKDAGTIISLTPRINDDGFIVMDIDLEKSTAQLGTNGLPTVDKTKIKSTLQVQDGEEILVGGLVEESETRSTQKIPFLSKLPFIKHLFNKETYSPTSKEIVVLITPKIVKQNIPTSDFGELVAGGTKVPPTQSFNPAPKPAQPKPNDLNLGNDWADDFGDEFGGL
ncbi:MAG: secretin and TonB N-terminal domain-containing protein [Candidatus Cloacimonetes bacterium]|nr:secretin and TonB N-terminal domain-containing protein [Candidatus Cloacimonadota bacterium]